MDSSPVRRFFSSPLVGEDARRADEGALSIVIRAMAGAQIESTPLPNPAAFAAFAAG
jgi:hypothetical protein